MAHGSWQIIAKDVGWYKTWFICQDGHLFSRHADDDTQVSETGLLISSFQTYSLPPHPQLIKARLGVLSNIPIE